MVSINLKNAITKTVTYIGCFDIQGRPQNIVTIKGIHNLFGS